MDVSEIVTSNEQVYEVGNGFVENNLISMSSDDENTVNLVKKRKRFFSEQSVDDEVFTKNVNLSPTSNENSDDEPREPITSIRKSRIKNNHTDSDSDTEDPNKNVIKRDGKKKFREKFDKFKNRNLKRTNGNSSEIHVQHKENTEETSSHINLSVCDPDESDDEENSITAIKKMIGSKSNLPPVKSKPIRMSAKEAMANMQKIKSESNRMLREKEVSLPYHRPKALSLKDIMNRRRPAISIDGKKLPIKMNEEQLKHYAMMLEERQKEMIELCKSESDEDNNESDHPTVNQTEASEVQPDQDRSTENVGVENDISFDQISQENSNQNEMPKEASHPLEHTQEIRKEDTRIDEIEHISYTSIQENIDEVITNSEKTNLANTDITDIIEETSTLDDRCKDNDSQMMILHDSEKTHGHMVRDSNNVQEETKVNECIDAFSDDLDCEDLDTLFENAEIIKDAHKPRENVGIVNEPKLTGAPGMLIRLDGEDSYEKPSGVDILKERFTYFANLQNMEDMEKDREKKYKPGTQHIKLKQQLEEEIAEQRSLEWAKRLEDERILRAEQKEILGDDSFDDIDKIEAKLEEGVEENDSVKDEIVNDDCNDDESNEDEDLIEDDVDMTDKPAKRNAMLDDEAEESDHDEQDGEEGEGNDDEESDSSGSEDELEQLKPKKGRILKAFEDSDDEDMTKDITENQNSLTMEHNNDKISQDDEIQLAQTNKSISDDLFPSQECDVVMLNKMNDGINSEELGTFSILNSKTDEGIGPIPVICETQNDNASLDDIVGMCSGSFSQNVVVPTQKSQLTPSLEFADDVVALCTGKFYDNQFVSQTNEKELVSGELLDTASLDTEGLPIPMDMEDKNNKENIGNSTGDRQEGNVNIAEEKKKSEENLLKSILNELDEPEYDKPKQFKYFPAQNENVRKKLVIDSDDEIEQDKKEEKNKKRRKRKVVRALQISDDEEEEIESDIEYESDGESGEKIYEYDSEENEVEVAQPKKRKIEFFENEAELTSEDEWAGSGDEDEAGLDRMEREDGDDDVFHEGKLQSELGQIHMREVLDQDKREVRLIQELLLEDADLGDGHRQRKFKWRNVDGEDESGTVEDKCDTQEEEFESEEMWRKQRHEREMYLKKMQENGEEDLNASINRTTIIKANLSSRTMSNLVVESKQSPVVKECIEKKSKDIPSPTKQFSILKQNYHGSFLTRGRGALARLAALATPLVVDDEVPKVLASARGNFVFTAKNKETKIKKRKAENTVGTPQLIKKMKTEEYKKTLFEQLRD